jgi:hypothetical protein
MPAVGADHHSSLLRDRAASRGMTADAGHPVIVYHDLFDGEPLAKLSPGCTAASTSR